MSELLNQVQSVSFEDLRNIPGWVCIAAGVAVPATVFSVDYFRTPKTTSEGLVGADVSLLDEVTQEETSGRLKSRLGRWASVGVAGLALSAASVQLLDPVTETEVSVSGVANVHVLDASESMRTRDMDDGLTRDESVTSALRSAYETAPDHLTAATVLFGQNAEVTSPLTTDRVQFANGLDASLINANGGSLDLALDRAGDILAGSDNPGGETLYVYTDGTIERREEAMSRLSLLAEDGTNIVVVMAGTADGSFKRSEFDTAPTPSGVDQRGFAQLDEKFENVSLLTTNGADDIEQTVSKVIKQDTTTTEKQPFYGFLWAAGGLLVASTALNAIQRWKRRGV